MPDDVSPTGPSEAAITAEGTPERRTLSPAAERALAEAEARREAAEARDPARPTEVNGRAGAEPTRYGDWEKNGIVSDF